MKVSKTNAAKRVKEPGLTGWPHRIWIELERFEQDPERNRLNAKMANAMLTRLGVTWGEFRYSEDRACYQWVDKASLMYRDCADDGEWFGLEKMAAMRAKD